MVGANSDDDMGSESGSAYVYRYDGTSWVYENKLLASDGDANDFLASSVAVSGDFVATGIPYDDSLYTNSGTVYMFELAGVSDAELLASDGTVYERLEVIPQILEITFDSLNSFGMERVGADRGFIARSPGAGVGYRAESARGLEGTVGRDEIDRLAGIDDRAFMLKRPVLSIRRSSADPRPFEPRP